MSELSAEELKRFEQEVAKIDIEETLKRSHSIEEWKELSKQKRKDYQSNNIQN